MNNTPEKIGMAALDKIRDAVIAGGDSYENFLNEFNKAMKESDDKTQEKLSKERDFVLGCV